MIIAKQKKPTTTTEINVE